MSMLRHDAELKQLRRDVDALQKQVDELKQQEAPQDPPKPARKAKGAE